MPVSKIIVPHFTDGLTFAKLTAPVQIELEFFDVCGAVQWTLRCDQQGGEFKVPTTFEYFNVQGKILAFDRTDVSKTQTPLVNCGRKGRGIQAETVTVNIVMYGPSPIFQLCVDIGNEMKDPSGLEDLVSAVGLSERARIVNVLHAQTKQIETIRSELDTFGQTYLSTLQRVEELQKENIEFRLQILRLKRDVDRLENTNAALKLAQESDEMEQSLRRNSGPGWTM